MFHRVHILRVVTKFSSCQVNTTSRQDQSNSKGFLLILCFFYFPLKVAGDHVHSGWGNPQSPPLNGSPAFLKKQSFVSKGITPFGYCYCHGTASYCFSKAKNIPFYLTGTELLSQFPGNTSLF